MHDSTKTCLKLRHVLYCILFGPVGIHFAGGDGAMKTTGLAARKICTVQIWGMGEKTAKELLTELLLKKAENLTCDEKTDKI